MSGQKEEPDMRGSRFLVAAVVVILVACGGKLPGGGGGVPGGDKIPGGGGVPGGLGGSSGMVDPNTCGNYSASEAGRRLKAFLEAVAELQKTSQETVDVVLTSCKMMGKELGMSEGDLGGEAKDV